MQNEANGAWDILPNHQAARPRPTPLLPTLSCENRSPMDFFNYKNGELYCEDVPAAKIARGGRHGRATSIPRRRCCTTTGRSPTRSSRSNATICYSIKSCGNINICKVLADEGCGFDVTSGGELFRASQAGGDPKKIIYAGVGKTDQEIADGDQRRHRRVQSRIGSGDREHRPRRRRDRQDRRSARIRINPDVDPKTHAKTTTGKKETKFGVDIERAERVFEQYRNLKNLRIGGAAHAHRLAGLRDPAVRRRGDEGRSR